MGRARILQAVYLLQGGAQDITAGRAAKIIFNHESL
jgi:hypothetical protein